MLNVETKKLYFFLNLAKKDCTEFVGQQHISKLGHGQSKVAGERHFQRCRLNGNRSGRRLLIK